MAVSTHDRVDRWLGELLATVPQGDSVAIILVHAAVDQTQRTVKSWRLGEAVENIDALISDIDDVAEADAEGLGGRQRYVLRAQVKGRDVGSLTLRYEVRSEEGAGPAVDSEPATMAGTIAVLQRHAEGAMRMMVQSFGGVIESYKEQVNAQKALIADFQKQASDNFRLQEELASKKLEQDLLLKERETQLQLTAAREAHDLEKSQMVWVEGMRKLYEWGPVILHYLTRGEAGKAPEEAVQDKQREAEEQLFANADEASIATWKKALSADQFAELMQRLAAYRARQPRETCRVVPPPSEDDKLVCRMASTLYEALAARVDRLEPLAMALFESLDFTGLGHERQRLVEELADDVSTTGVHVTAPTLWGAFGGLDMAALLPLVGCLRSGSAWNELERQQKVHLMGIAAQAQRHASREQ